MKRLYAVGSVRYEYESHRLLLLTKALNNQADLRLLEKYHPINVMLSY